MPHSSSSVVLPDVCGTERVKDRRGVRAQVEDEYQAVTRGDTRMRLCGVQPAVTNSMEVKAKAGHPIRNKRLGKLTYLIR